MEISLKEDRLHSIVSHGLPLIPIQVVQSLLPTWKLPGLFQVAGVV